MAKILVADDNSNIQKMVGLALKDQGIDVVAVGNGEGDGLGLGDGDEGEVEADPEGGNAEGVVRTATLVVVPHAASTITAASASRPVLRLIGKTTRAAGRGLRGVVLGAQAHKDKQKRGPNHP